MSRYLAAAQEQARRDQDLAAEANHNASAELSRHWGNTHCSVCGDMADGMRWFDQGWLDWHGVTLEQLVCDGWRLYTKAGIEGWFYPCSGCKPEPPAEYVPLRIR